MSDIFISYKSSDKERVRVLVGALEQRGWSVWWDREIPPGKTFDEVIEEELNAARCVIVVWSKDSALSEWVKTEASEGAKREILVPVLIDDVKIPLEFRRIQAAWLVDWHGTLPHPGFDQLSGAIARIIGHSPDNVLSNIEKQEVESKHQEEAKRLDQERQEREAHKKTEEERKAEAKRKFQHKEEHPPAFKWSKIAVGVSVVILALIIGYYLNSNNKDKITVPLPKVEDFKAVPETVEKGKSSFLEWSTSNAKEVEIIGIGKVKLFGLQEVTPEETTTYTLVARNEEGKIDERKVKVEVNIPVLRIEDFKAVPPTVEEGESSTLSWETSNAKEVTLNGKRVISSDSVKVKPEKTTTYTLIAKNEEGKTVEAEVKIEVKIPILPPEVGENVSAEDVKRLEAFLKEKLGGKLPKDAKVAVKGYERSPVKGFKKGGFTVEASGKSGDIPFLISQDGRYVIFGESIDTQTFKNAGVTGLKKGAIPLGRQQIPILLSEDGRYIMLGELVDSKGSSPEETLKRSFGARMPADAKINVNGYETSPVKGFKKGKFVISSSKGSGEVPFLVSQDGKYIIVAEPLDTASFQDTKVAGMKKGELSLGRQPVPILMSSDGKYLILGELIDSTVNPP